MPLKLLILTVEENVFVTFDQSKLEVDLRKTVQIEEDVVGGAFNWHGKM
jgi:hypothetical protein